MSYTWYANEDDISVKDMGVLGQVKKLETAPADVNASASQSNQNAIIVD